MYIRISLCGSRYEIFRQNEKIIIFNKTAIDLTSLTLVFICKYNLNYQN